MRYFNVTEALQYLNKLAPDVSPRNEETLRRAIRNGELPAEVNRGREGSRIAEADLINFGRKYIAKQSKKTSLAFPGVEAEASVASLMLPATLAEILANAVHNDEKQTITKIKILENKRKWEQCAAELKVKISELENELALCESEINAMSRELML